jgi:type I restriction enzyme S subunit
MVDIGKIIKLASGKGLTQQNIIQGEYPVYGGNGINGYHNENNNLSTQLRN